MASRHTSGTGGAEAVNRLARIRRVRCSVQGCVSPAAAAAPKGKEQRCAAEFCLVHRRARVQLAARKLVAAIQHTGPPDYCRYKRIVHVGPYAYCRCMYPNH